MTFDDYYTKFLTEGMKIQSLLFHAKHLQIELSLQKINKVEWSHLKLTAGEIKSDCQEVSNGYERCKEMLSFMHNHKDFSNPNHLAIFESAQKTMSSLGNIAKQVEPILNHVKNYVKNRV